MKKLFIILILTYIILSESLNAQEALKEEYRAAWIATVSALDWPNSISADKQYQIYGPDGLIQLLDDLKAVGMNAVFFQVRPQCDALYESNYEPWSEFVSGQEGTSPGYDPLAIVIEECHKRGMELHAWFNPYRASVYSASGKGMVSDHPMEIGALEGMNRKAGITPELAHDNEHVTNKHPEWILQVGDKLILDPGLPEVKQYITDVVMDVVTRYDVDGVHFDDYFYPYPPNHIDNEDIQTFNEYNRGFTNIDNWRRDNINLMIKQVADSIRSVKDYVKFGISPFGIYKNGVPSGIVGLDAYSVIYSDPRAWISDGTIDYLTPQTYWKTDFTISNGIRFSRAQDFIGLTNWWADQVGDIHLYTGMGAYRADGATFSGETFSTNEMPQQIAHVQAQDDILGSVYFRADNLSQYSTKGLADSLKNNYYKYPALPPRMTYRTDVAPATPVNFSAAVIDDNRQQVQISWEDGSGDESARFVVYRVDASADIDPANFINNAENIVALTGETSIIDTRPDDSSEDVYYFVTEINRVGEESAPTSPINVGTVTDLETEDRIATTWQVGNAYPNPFNPSTRIEINLSQPSSISYEVFDLMGRVVAQNVEERWSAGTHYININASNWRSGVYLIRVKSAYGDEVRRITLLK